MESDKSIMPKIDLLPRVSRAANFVGRIVRNTNVPVPLHMSSHYHAEHFTGAAAMLDEALDPHAVSEGWLPFDDQGNYLDPTEI